MGLTDWKGETQAEVESFKREAQQKYGTGNFVTPADAFASALKAKREREAENEAMIANNMGTPGGGLVSSGTGGVDHNMQLASATAPSASPTTFPIPPMPVWDPSDEKLHDVSKGYADIQINPVKEALKRAIEQAKLDADSQTGRIEAAYAGIPAELERMEGRQARTDLESAISRGGGRAGAVEWASAERGEHFASLLAQAEGQKAAEITAIANQLGLTKRQAEERKIELEQLRGMLIQDHLFNLQNQRYDRGMHQWQVGAGHALNIFDRTQLTPWERYQLYFQGSDLFPGSPGSLPNQWGAW